MNKKIFYLAKNVLLFALNGFLPKVLSFILIPIYTGCLTTGEYGISDLITTTVQLLVPIFTLDIQDAVMRFAMDQVYSKKDVFSSAIRVICGGLVCVILGCVVVSLLHIPGLEPSYLIFLVIMYAITSLQNSVNLFCKGIDQVKVIVVAGVLNSVITLSTNILFLVVFQWGLVGYLAANSIGHAVSLVYMFFGAKLYRYVHWKATPQVSKAMRAFSFPLIFSALAWWVNNAADRYMLSWLAGVSISGIYAVAYKIPNLLSVFQNIFTQAWSISAIKEFDKDDSDGFIGNMYTMMNFAMVLVCSLIMLVNLPLAKILYSNEFFHAWHYVPPLLISVVFNAMALFIGSIFTAVKDTKTLSVSTIAGAAANIVCNVIMIPLWDAAGAAIATLIGYAVTLMMRHLILRKHIRMKIRWKRDLVVYAVLLLQMLIAFQGWQLIWVQMICTCLVLWMYSRELNVLLSAVKNLLKRK